MDVPAESAADVGDTFTASRSLRGGSTQSPKGAWQVPLAVPWRSPLSLWCGVDESRIFQHIRIRNSATQMSARVPKTSKPQNESSLGRMVLRRFLCFCGDEAGNVWFSILISL